MCVKPILTPEGHTVACGRCGACIQAKKWDWTNRAIAETITSPWAGTISLSYDGSEKSSDSLRAFRYSDIQNWLKRLRENGNTSVRYIVAGERGSKRKRVHWHCILWSPVNIWKIGRWADFQTQFYQTGSLPSAGPHPAHLCDPKLRTRLVWDQWPFGHVFLDGADKNSVEYVMKYTQKDRFNAVQSRGQKHERKAEVSGAGMFRMSKYPPLGADFMDQTLQAWKAKNHVPPTMRLTVPGVGTWLPSDTMRERLLAGLADIFNASMETHKKPPAGWQAMVSHMDQTEAGQKIMDRLTYLQEFPEFVKIVKEGRQHEISEEEIADIWDAAEAAATQAHCGGANPCRACAAGLTDHASRASGLYSYKVAKAYHQARETGGTPAGETADQYHSRLAGPNPWCRKLGPSARARTRPPGRKYGNPF